ADGPPVVPEPAGQGVAVEGGGGGGTWGQGANLPGRRQVGNLPPQQSGEATMTAQAKGSVGQEALGTARSFLPGWDRFWFLPSEPTTLGLIRICTGLVVLYVHLVYSFDLQGMLGKEGWISKDRMEKMRTQSPTVLQAADWSGQPVQCDREPQTEQERAAASRYAQ